MFKELNIMKIFFEEPNREFNVRETGRILRISPATASSHLNSLVNKGILTWRGERNLKLYKADLDREEYRDLKIFYNIRKIKDSGLLDSLNKFYLKPTIVLFGSAVTGLDTETSDFDILVIAEKTVEFKNLEVFEKKIRRKLQIFAVKDVKELKNPHLINNVLNGITIQGKVKWI